jgi:hypothetical protein
MAGAMDREADRLGVGLLPRQPHRAGWMPRGLIERRSIERDAKSTGPKSLD